MALIIELICLHALFGATSVDVKKMTLCVAIKVPCSALNPNRRPLEFNETGIVIASDSRYSWVGDPIPQDDGMKLWPLSDWVIAGFSGDVELAERSLISMKKTVISKSLREYEMISRGTRNWLQYFQNLLTKRRKVLPTSVQLGIYDSKRNRFILYFLSSDDDFNPSPREGIWSIGSGASEFPNILSNEIEHFSYQWSALAHSGFKLVDKGGAPVVEPWSKEELVQIPILNVANLLVSSLDLFLEVSNLKTVGGLVQCAMLTNTGISYGVGKKRSSAGKWKDITAIERRSYFQMIEKKFVIPHMNDDLTIE